VLNGTSCGEVDGQSSAVCLRAMNNSAGWVRLLTKGPTCRSENRSCRGRSKDTRDWGELFNVYVIGLVHRIADIESAVNLRKFETFGHGRAVS
jgi:hypothetical protein